jgi:hypothetical protein
MGLSMGRELESRLAKTGFLGMSLKEMLDFFIKEGDTDAVAKVQYLINSEENRIHGTKRNSTAKSLVAANVTKKTAAKSTSKARRRSAVK